MRPIPAIITAGDGKAAKAIHGQSKAYLEVGGEPMVARVASVLQRVPEVSEVWVVGDPRKLEAVLSGEAFRAGLRKPLVVVPQCRNLLENAWQTFRRLLPGAPQEGRDPLDDAERDRPILYLSADLPFATPQEISHFIRLSEAADCDYALGLVSEESMEPFYPTDDAPGIQMAYFQVAEGRVRQSNLHLVRPARIGNRQGVEDMYEHRYQKQIGSVIGLASKLLASEGGGLRIAAYFGLMHVALLLDRIGLRRLADLVRRPITFAKIDRACSSLLKTRVRLVVTEVGGCGVDIDNAHDLDVARRNFERWAHDQEARAEALHGPLPLPALAGVDPGPWSVRILAPGPLALPGGKIGIAAGGQSKEHE